MVREMDIIVPIALSTCPLWWCAPTPANLIVWLNLDSSAVKSADVNAVPLSEIYRWTKTP